MNSIELHRVSLDYYIYSIRAKFIRSALFDMAIGGRVGMTSGDVVGIKALADVSFQLQEGDRLGIVGHNGSGKTSLLRVLAGIYPPTKGVIKINGTVTSSISLGAGMDSEASGLENIEKMGLMRMIPMRVIRERRDSIIEFSGLGDFVKLPINTYSSGMLARLMFAMATEFDADILVLDEWLGAGDAEFIAKAEERMRTFVGNARTVILASHNFGLIKHVCNKVCVLNKGSVEFLGSVDQWWNEHAGPEAVA